jgi:cytidylate kinase
MHPESITVSGLPGSGTSTVARAVAEQTGFAYVNVGVLFRALADERGMSLNDFETFCEKNPDVDRELDERQAEILARGRVVMEGRLSGWVAHRHGIDALKVWLSCDEAEAVRRIIEREGGTVEEARRQTEDRVFSESKRYRDFYGIDITETHIYDVVIDTTAIPPAQVVDRIMASLQA